MATALLMHPNINVSYFDADVLNTLPTIAAQNIVAFNSNNVPQNLNLAGTSNMNLHALKNVNIEHGATNKLVISTGDNTGASNSYLSVDFNNRVILSDVTSSGVTLTSTDTIIGTTHLAEQTDYLKISSALNYGISIDTNLGVNSNLGVSGIAYLQSNINVQGDANIFGNLTTQGKFLTNEMAIYKNAPATTDATQVGYSWVIDAHDRLELVKYTYFTNDTVVTKKIATFGYNNINLGDASDITYTSTKFASTFNMPTPLSAMFIPAPVILQAFSDLFINQQEDIDLTQYFANGTSYTLGSPASNLNITTAFFYYGPGGTPAPVSLLNSTTLEVNARDGNNDIVNYVLASITGNTLSIFWTGIGILYKIGVIATNQSGTANLEINVQDIFNN